MTEEEKLEANKIIVEYLGYKTWLRPTTYNIEGNPVTLWKLHYHESMEWLWPVVVKLMRDERCFDFIINDKCVMINSAGYSFYRKKSNYSDYSSEISTIFAAVVDFLTYLNESDNWVIKRISKWADSERIVFEDMRERDANKLVGKLNRKEPDPMSIMYIAVKL